PWPDLGSVARRARAAADVQASCRRPLDVGCPGVRVAARGGGFRAGAAGGEGGPRETCPVAAAGRRAARRRLREEARSGRVHPGVAAGRETAPERGDARPQARGGSRPDRCAVPARRTVTGPPVRERTGGPPDLRGAGPAGARKGPRTLDTPVPVRGGPGFRQG